MQGKHSKKVSQIYLSVTKYTVILSVHVRDKVRQYRQSNDTLTT